MEFLVLNGVKFPLIDAPIDGTKNIKIIDDITHEVKYVPCTLLAVDNGEIDPNTGRPYKKKRNVFYDNIEALWYKVGHSSLEQLTNYPKIIATHYDKGLLTQAVKTKEETVDICTIPITIDKDFKFAINLEVFNTTYRSMANGSTTKKLTNLYGSSFIHHSSIQGYYDATITGFNFPTTYSLNPNGIGKTGRYSLRADEFKYYVDGVLTSSYAGMGILGNEMNPPDVYSAKDSTYYSDFTLSNISTNKVLLTTLPIYNYAGNAQTPELINSKLDVLIYVQKINSTTIEFTLRAKYKNIGESVSGLNWENIITACKYGIKYGVFYTTPYV